MIRKFAALLTIFILVFASANSQNKKTLTLKDVIEMAKTQSSISLQAKNKFSNSYWQYHIYRSSKYPSLSLDATVPNYFSSIRRIPVADGSDIFIRSEYFSANAGLTLSQRIGLTGGNVFVNSGLQQLTLIKPFGDTTYVSTPVNIGFNQPIFGFNPYKWDNKIEPLKYQEAKQQYLEDVENICLKATESFFDLLLAQSNLESALANKSTYDTLYKISKGRYEIGTIAENDLLQMELNMLNANVQVSQAKLDVQVKTLQLKSLLGIKDDSQLELISPMSSVNFFAVDLTTAQSFALKNRPSLINNQILLLEAKRDVSKAKRENRFSVNIFGSYGLTQSADYFDAVYNQPLDQQQLVIGVQIPIVDWGKAKAQIKMALSNQQLVQAQVEQSQADFEQEIFIKVMQFNMQKDLLTIAAKADTVAQRRFVIAKQRFLIGKIDIETLSLAQKEKETARSAYMLALRTYWQSYFEIRRITLYDFETSQPLTAPYDALVK